MVGLVLVLVLTFFEGFEILEANGCILFTSINDSLCDAIQFFEVEFQI